MKKAAAKWGCLISVVGVLLLPFAVREFQTPAGRKALPVEAADVDEHLTHGIVGGDFARFLKAALPPERYSDYARALNLSDRFDPQANEGIRSILNMSSGDAPPWWNPPEVDSTSYFEHREGDDFMRVLRYHDGSVYLLVLSW